MIDILVEWLVNEFDKAIKIKREDMRDKRPGSITSFEPKVIWVKMITRPGAPSLNLAGEKFNVILEETLHKTRNMFVMEIDQSGFSNEASFEKNNGNLNFRGKAQYWNEFDKLLKRFDKQEITLKPKPIVSQALAARKEKEASRVNKE